jgi:hypothetical protein
VRDLSRRGRPGVSEGLIGCGLSQITSANGGHADIRTTEVYFIRKQEDAEVAARTIQVRLTGRKSE